MVKIFRAFYILLLPIAIILVGCDLMGQNKNNFYDTTKSIDLSKENINSISFQSTFDDVKREFGEPTEIQQIKKPPYYYIVYKDKNGDELLDVRFVDDKVQRYMVSTNSLYTASGITVGSSKKDVIEEYGDTFYERTETGVNVIGYFDKENKINIEFILTEETVTTIIVSKSRGAFSVTHN